MPLMSRLSRLFRADIHAVLDRIEEPDVLLRQAVREMEEALEQAQRRARRLAQAQQRDAARAAELERSLASLEEELGVCFEAAKDDLARRTIRRQLEARRQLDAVNQQRAGNDHELEKLRARLAEDQARLEYMRCQLRPVAEVGAHDPHDGPWPMTDVAVRDEDVEVAFLREQRKRRVS